MTTDFRALCAELAQEVEHLWSIVRDDNNEPHPLANRARALLAQPVAEGPTDDKLMDIARATNLVYYMGEGCGFASPYVEEAEITAEVLAFARAVLAKWGHQ